jgi:hypothetical protein
VLKKRNCQKITHLEKDEVNPITLTKGDKNG